MKGSSDGAFANAAPFVIERIVHPIALLVVGFTKIDIAIPCLEVLTYGMVFISRRERSVWARYVITHFNGAPSIASV